MTLLQRLRAQLQDVLRAGAASESGVCSAEQLTQIETITAQIKSAEIMEQTAAVIEAGNASAGRVGTGGGSVSGGTAREGLAPNAFAGLHDFCRAAQARQVNQINDPRLDSAIQLTQRAVAAGMDSSAGLLVPPMQATNVFQAIADINDPLAALCYNEENSGLPVTVLVDATTPWGALGLQSYWTAEHQKIVASRPALNPRSIPSTKLACLVHVSDELWSSAPNFESRVTVGAATSLSWERHDAIIRGNGIGKPLGILSSTARVVVSRLAGGGVIDTIDVLKMRDVLLTVPGRTNPHYIVNPRARSMLQTGAIVSGGDSFPLLVTQNGRDLLNGLPVIWSEACSALGTAGDIILADMGGYYLGESSVKYASTLAFRFDTDEQSLRWTVRVTGSPLLTNTIAAGDGTAVANYVTLNTI